MVSALLLIVAILALAAAALLLWQSRSPLAAYERLLDTISHQVSERVRFRPPVRLDEAFYAEMAADPVAAEANGWTGDEVGSVRERFGNEAKFDALRRSEFVAIDRVTGDRIGTVTFSLSPLDRENARSLGVHVHPAHRNRGYGVELTAGGLLVLQQKPGPVHVGTRVTNHGMQQIMRKLGYEPEPGSRPFDAPDGTSYEALWYECGADIHPPML